MGRLLLCSSYLHAILQVKWKNLGELHVNSVSEGRQKTRRETITQVPESYDQILILHFLRYLVREVAQKHYSRCWSCSDHLSPQHPLF